MSDWIRIITPDGSLWEPQELCIRKSLIAGVQWNKKLGANGSENGVRILLMSNSGLSQQYWVRCKDAETAKILYESILEDLQANAVQQYLNTNKSLWWLER